MAVGYSSSRKCITDVKLVYVMPLIYQWEKVSKQQSSLIIDVQEFASWSRKLL